MRSIAALLFAAALSITLQAPAAERDVVIILDNSGSMRVYDPHRLMHDATRKVLDEVDAGTRIALLVFDERIELSVPLTFVTRETRPRLDAAIDRIDYSGPWTHIPEAIERALYHLHREGRPGAIHDILFLTDGFIDYGDPQRDREGERWLFDDLVPLAQDRGVRIFGVAFSEEADFRLIQSLSNRTSAEHLRVLEPEGLADAFESLWAALTHVPEPEPEPEVEAPAAPEPAAPVTAPVIIPEPVPPPPTAPVWPWFVAVLVLLTGTLALLVLRRRPEPAAALQEDDVPGAVLVDAKQVSGHTQHMLRTAVSVIGRHPAPGPGIVTSIVIPETTVSRKHASIRWKDGRYWVEDHQSSNGTFVNDVRVSGEAPLNDGDVLRVDTFAFEFREQQVDETMVRGSGDDAERTQVRGSMEPEDAERTSFDITSFGRTEVGAELADPVPAPTDAVSARFEYEGDVKFVDRDKPLLHIGRAEDNNLVVDAGRGISRNHATVERKADGYHLTCKSAQRVLLRSDGLERVLKEGESVLLPETGEILLAGSLEKATHKPIRFWVE